MSLGLSIYEAWVHKPFPCCCSSTPPLRHQPTRSLAMEPPPERSLAYPKPPSDINTTVLVAKLWYYQLAGKVNRRNHRKAREDRKYLDTIEMSSADRNIVEHMMSDIGMDIPNEPYMAWPGEEGLDISYEGKEYEAFEGLSEQIADLSNYCYVDSQTWHNYIEHQIEQ
ncbi:uncharacterized protein F5147DRAFT_651000 [Suillus discolor]|uniref:Uncharacterized protein n=1 Tax=Suillus discolor TaxID=1912936 RepID=A0A9P7FCR5_9AGAM|nr:uncharacterized protein F5147DRAFT_651000 [Suillus discolor]KAG2112366.1 hypothetical protein F5147DRAFT_651000 [Suillus discolor]